MKRLPRLRWAQWAAALLFSTFFPHSLMGQAIEFDSGGLRYQTLTREGLTIMFTILPTTVRDFTILQVAISNGSPSSRTVKPEDFKFYREDGLVIPAIPPRDVVTTFLNKAGRNDVVKLVSTYELGLYGLSRFNSTNGYEVRRQSALAEVSSARLKAAAAASAIVFVSSRLRPGESTDGALFFPGTNGRPIRTGKLVATVGVERFEFEVGGDHHPGDLIRRP
jgi:hypothetical protein